MSTSPAEKLAIVCGGGPAPGINNVIAATTVRARRRGVEVLGVRGGFRGLMEGDTTHVVALEEDAVSSFARRGGSALGIARANPTTSEALLARTLDSLTKLGVGALVTIGGDDTAFSASRLATASRGRLRVVHVPKTIDNDLDLPDGIATFGFETARDLGTRIVQNLAVDAETTGRWYLVVAMGRKAGHLALGMGSAAGAPLTLIPEELARAGSGGSGGAGGKPVARLATIVDVLAGAVLKRLARGAGHGVAVLAEGLVEALPEDDLASVPGLENAERDEHGHVRLAEVDLGAVLKAAVQKRLAELGLKTTIVAKNVGYELRCADPVPQDLEYTRDLGDAAARYVLEGGTETLISIQNGHFRPIPFAEILDAKTGKMRVRMVDVNGDRYRFAREAMTRLTRADLADEDSLASLARVAKLSPTAFRDAFQEATAGEPAPWTLFAGAPPQGG